MSATNFRILILDDDQMILEVLSYMLKSTFDVEATADSGEARVLLHRGFDVFICDYRMPKDSGLRLLEEISGEYPAMRRVLLTGAAPDDDDVLNSLKISAVIQKPIRPAELITQLKTLASESLRSKDEFPDRASF